MSKIKLNIVSPIANEWFHSTGFDTETLAEKEKRLKGEKMVISHEPHRVPLAIQNENEANSLHFYLPYIETKKHTLLKMD